MCKKAVNTYHCTMLFVYEMCDTLVNTCVFVFHSLFDLCRTQEMCERVVSEDSFMMIYFPYKYKTQNMYVEAVDDCLAVLKFIPDWFVTSYMVLYSLMMICFFLIKILIKSYFLVKKMVFIFSVDFNKINLDSNKDVDKDDPETIIHVKLLENTNHLKRVKS